MSLINQVLQDLDRRHAGGVSIPLAARSVPLPNRPQRGLRWAGALAAVGVIAALAFVAALIWQSAQARGPTPPAGTAAAASRPSTLPAAAASTPAIAASATSVTPAIAASATSVTSAIAASVTSVTSAPMSSAFASDSALAPASAAQPSMIQPERSTAAPAVQAGAAPPSAALPVLGRPSVSAVSAGPAGLSTASIPAASPDPVVSPAPVTSAALASSALRAPLALALRSPPALAPAPQASQAPPAAIAAPALATPVVEARVEKRIEPLSAHERADAQYQRGLDLHQRGQVRDAQAAFANALQDERGHAPARQALAVALVDQGRLDEAQALLTEGLQLNPQQAQLALTLARIKAGRHDLPGAIDALKSALANAGSAARTIEQAQVRALLATLQQSAGQHAEAIENYAAALRSAPNSGPWWIGMGISLAADGRAESAREAFTRARSTDTLTPELLQYVDQRLGAATR